MRGAALLLGHRPHFAVAAQHLTACSCFPVLRIAEPQQLLHGRALPRLLCYHHSLLARHHGGRVRWLLPEPVPA